MDFHSAVKESIHKFYSYFLPEKQGKYKVNYILSNCGFYNVNHIYVFITIFAVNNLCFRIYPCLLLLSLTLFVGQFLSACASSHVWLTASFSSIFAFTQKSDYDVTFIPKSNLTLSVTSINTLPVKLSTMIWGYVISFVNMSACLSDFTLKDIYFTS